jgi:hypothetical protein
MDMLSETRARNAELADHLAFVMDAPLPPLDRGPWPLRFPLWKLEFFADHSDWINEAYRCRVATALLDHWRERLNQKPPGAWRLIFYEDVSPTLAICPASAGLDVVGGTAISVSDPGDVMRAFLGRRWEMLGSSTVTLPCPDQILAEIAAHQGSLGRDTAQALGLKPGHLRFLIEQEGLKESVNHIRCTFGQPAEKFRQADRTATMPYRIYEDPIARAA